MGTRQLGTRLGYFEVRTLIRVPESPSPYTSLHSESVGRNRSGCRRADRRRGLLVDQLFELLARLEVRHFLRRHVHLVAGFRVAALSRLALAQPETAEPAQLHFLAAVQRLDDAPEHGVDDYLGVLLREIGHARNFLDELRLGHAAIRHC